jgi:hypothetical protein
VPNFNRRHTVDSLRGVKMLVRSRYKSHRRRYQRPWDWSSSSLARCPANEHGQTNLHLRLTTPGAESAAERHSCGGSSLQYSTSRKLNVGRDVEARYTSNSKLPVNEPLARDHKRANSLQQVSLSNDDCSREQTILHVSLRCVIIGSGDQDQVSSPANFTSAQAAPTSFPVVSSR